MQAIDQLYQCQIPGEVFGLWTLQCRLRIFYPRPEIQTVVITDMGFEMGWFIPYLVERLMETIVTEFQLEPHKLIWIEHYTPSFKKPTSGDFSQVTVDWCEGVAVNPHWCAITPATADRLMLAPVFAA